MLFRIKPLNWTSHTTSTDFSHHTADTLCGRLVVEQASPRLCTWWIVGVKVCEKCDSILAGKAAAEAFYRKKLAAALEPIETPAAVSLPTDVVDLVKLTCTMAVERRHPVEVQDRDGTWRQTRADRLQQGDVFRAVPEMDLPDFRWRVAFPPEAAFLPEQMTLYLCNVKEE